MKPQLHERSRPAPTEKAWKNAIAKVRSADFSPFPIEHFSPN
ncbi:MAG: hypothetical protein ACRC62_14250 [Microcoleus sp.]